MTIVYEMSALLGRSVVALRGRIAERQLPTTTETNVAAAARNCCFCRNLADGRACVCTFINNALSAAIIDCSFILINTY